MPPFTLKYTREVSEEVVASDRDHAGMAAIAAGASPQGEVYVVDSHGARFEMIDICESCDRPIWDDQTWSEVDELVTVHDECPCDEVLAGGAGARITAGSLPVSIDMLDPEAPVVITRAGTE